MARKRGRKRPESAKIVEEEVEKTVVEESGDENPSVDAVAPSVSEPELARPRLRERWELASVLNFLRVFKPLIQSKLVLSPEEIETALIRPNADLSELHISLLKGIPPVNKNLTAPDAWVAILHRKLVPWWPWVAEGEIPIAEKPGEELSRYKELDPIDRLLILKALCELRALQDDAVSYINDALKQGTEICNFRKDRIEGNDTGIAYWNDGDEVMGYRLYKEVAKAEFTPRKGKGRLTQPPSNYQWETLATNLEEFQRILDKFSSSDIAEEASIAEVVKNEIIPALERVEKKRERALKRQQKQVMLLNGYLNSYQVGATRSCRNRKPVSYTFDEYDRTIDEAIQLNKKRKKNQEPKHGRDGGKESNSNGNALDNGVTNHDTDDDGDGNEKFRGDGENDSGDQDYDSKSDENGYGDQEKDEDSDNYSNGDIDSSEKENNIPERATGASRHAQRTNANSTRDTGSLRRSKRIPGNAGQSKLENHVKMRGQRSQTSNSDSASESNSDGGSSAGSDSATKSDHDEGGSSAGNDSVGKSESGDGNMSADNDSGNQSESDDGNSSKASTDKASDGGKGSSEEEEDDDDGGGDQDGLQEESEGTDSEE